jgi:hypothetical protein
MNWLNIPIEVLRSEAYIDADPTQRATWLSLMGYCCHQENSGQITACRDWKDRKWQQLASVTREEVLTSSSLWSWEADTLTVAFYPLDKQKEVQAKRRSGSRGGRISKRKSKPKAQLNDSFKQSAKHTTKQCDNGTGRELEGKGKELEGKCEETPTPHSQSETSLFTRRLNDLCPHWGGPIVNPQEAHDFTSALPLLRDIDQHDHWPTLAAYIAHRRQRDPLKPWPRSRAECLANLSEALDQARTYAAASAPAQHGRTTHAGGRTGHTVALSDLIRAEEEQQAAQKQP